MTLRIRIGCLVLLLVQISIPTFAFAQNTVSQACFGDVYHLMDREQRLYRSVLFGQKNSADSPIGSTRTDSDFSLWMKTAENEWRSLADGYEGTTWSDVLMDDRADVPPRRGLMEQKRTPTSDLLPPILQSMRALQCRLRSVCELSRLNVDHSTGSVPVIVEVEGCMALSYKPLNSCVPQDINDIGFGACEAVVNSVIQRESELLHLLVAYDSAYRSVLQFGGGFEGFLSDVRLPLLQPLWQALRVLGSLDSLPCFLAQCDE